MSNNKTDQEKLAAIIEALGEQGRDTGVHDAVVRALRETLRPDVLANAS